MTDSKDSGKGIARTLQKRGVRLKIYVQRFLSYSAAINFIMLIFLVMTKLAEMGLTLSKTMYGVVFAVLLSSAVLIGYLDVKLGFFRSEIEFNQTHNPVINDIRNRIQRIEEKLK